MVHGVFCDLFVCKDVESFLLHGVSHGSLIRREAEHTVKRSTGHLPLHNVVDVIPEADISHEVFGQLVDSLVLDKPLAEIERGANHSRFIYQHIFCQLKAGIEHAFLVHSVFDQIFAVDDGLVNEALVLDAIDQKVQEGSVSLAVLKGPIEPLLPTGVDLS